MKAKVSWSGTMLALILMAAAAPAQQQGTEKKPVPTFSNDDVPAAGSSVSITGDNSWSRANAAWQQLKSIRARMTLSSPNGQMEGRFEAVQPDRFHMSMAGVEIIKIGDDFFIRTPGSAWKRRSSSGSDAFSFKSMLADDLLKGGQPTLVGAEKVDGIDADIYDVSGVTGLNGTARVWIGKSDGFLRKLEANTSGMPVVVVFYDFNKNDISIRAPM